MNSIIAWFTRNAVAANLLMVAIIFGGFYTMTRSIPTEVFPEFELDVIEVGVQYRGSTPTETEELVVVKVEEAVQDLEGIKEITSSSAEGAGAITIEVAKGYDPRELLDDVKNRVDSISTFPDETENPTVRVAQRRGAVITIALSAEMSERELRRLGEQVRDELSNLPNITQVSLQAVRPYEIAVEVSEATLQRYGLTLSGVAQAINRSSLDLPAGAIKTTAGEVLLRTKGQAYSGEDFADIVLLTREDGTRVTVGDIAEITDGFEETPLETRFNGKPAVLIVVQRVGDQNAIELADSVKSHVEANLISRLPPGVEVDYWNDRSKIVRGRLNTLLSSAKWGTVLVIGVLALFLRPAIAFWVFLGVPVAMMGAIAAMPLFDVTFNIFSLFAFILVLGIIVDDAIVTGENVFTHLKNGDDSTKAAIAGTQEVALPVIFGVLTTVIAFVPLLMIEGDRGKLFGQIALVVIPALLFSLVESKLILPAHLKHLKAGQPEKASLNPLMKAQRTIADGLERFILKGYGPVLRAASANRYLTLSIFIGVAVIIFSVVASSRVLFIFFPRVASETATATLSMPLGTPSEVTARHVAWMAQQAEALQEKYRDPETGEEAILNIMSVTGSSGVTRGRGSGGSGGSSHLGEVAMRMVPPEERKSEVTGQQLVQEWRQMIGSIPGAEQVSFRAEIGRGGEPINVQLAGPSFEEMGAVASEIKARLETYPGVFGISDSFEDGKQEIELRIKPEAEALGLSLSDLANQAREAFYGAEAQRIQRGREEVRVMVRYPLQERQSVASLEQMQVRAPDGTEVPFSAVADASIGRGFSTIRRIDRNRTVSVTADVDKESVNMAAVEGDLGPFVAELVARYPGMSYTFEGEARERADSFGSLRLGSVGVFFAIYSMLAIPFRSYVQPFIVMSVIPFGIVGAILGHIIMGMSLSLMSIFGMLALCGVVVNDSLVLVDYVNRRRREGMSVVEAVRTAGVARFRAILLTSMTTFAGLMPLLFEKSTQAQFLIPMAVSLGFGILFATFITLFLVPINYLVLNDLEQAWKRLWHWEIRSKPAVSAES